MALLFSDVETREALKRMKEAALAFGKQENHQTYVIGVSDTALLTDYVMRLQDKEHKRRLWNKTSPQIKYRRPLINLLMKICAKERLSFATTYLAIYLLDSFMDRHSICESQLPVMAIVCIVLAGKMIEVDRGVPRYTRLTQYICDGCNYYHRAPMGPVEHYVLRTFNFSIIVPTEVNFLDVFLMYAVDGMKASEEADPNNNNDDNNNNNNDPMPNANYPEEEQVVEVKLYSSQTLPGAEKLPSIRETAFKILQDLAMVGPQNHYPVSLIAASILLAARREHGLNFWTPNLDTVTTYNLDEVQECLTTYLQPRIDKGSLSLPFKTPYFLNFILDPYIEDIDDDSD